MGFLGTSRERTRRDMFAELLQEWQAMYLLMRVSEGEDQDYVRGRLEAHREVLLRKFDDAPSEVWVAAKTQVETSKYDESGQLIETEVRDGDGRVLRHWVRS